MATSLPLDLAARQFGLLTVAQLRRAGVSESAQRHQVRSGRLVRVAPRVFAVAGSADTVERRAMAAVLDSGGVLSGRSAAAWWGVPGFEPEPFAIARGRGRRRRSSHLAVVRHLRSLEPRHVTRWRGLPLTRPSRTLFDLAGAEHPARVERAYDTMWARGLVTPRAMSEMLRDLGRPGVRGVGVMRTLIEERSGLSQPIGSRLEGRVETLVGRAGLPALRRQVDVGDDEWTGRMDFVAPDRPLVVEVDSAIHHAALSDRRRDDLRTARLRSQGWVVLRLTEDDVWNRPGKVVDQLIAAWHLAGR